MPTAPKYAPQSEEAEADEAQEVVAEEETVEEEGIDLNAAIEEDVNALLAGEDLSEAVSYTHLTLPTNLSV